MTDSVTVTFRLFGENNPPDPVYGPAIEGVDYGVSTHTWTFGPNESDNEDPITGLPTISFFALAGNHLATFDRQMLVGLEILSANSDSVDPEITYNWSTVTSETVLAGNWPAGQVTQYAPPPPPDLLPSCDCWSEKPVRVSDGAVLVTATDIGMSNGGLTVTRDWTNTPGAARGAPVNVGTVVNQQASVIQVSGDDNELAVIMDAHTTYYFDLVGSVYQPHGFIRNTLAYESDDLVMTEPSGARYRFYGFSSPDEILHGRLRSYADAGGSETTLEYDEDKGRLLTITRESSIGGTTITEQLAYSYVAAGVNQGLVGSILLRRKSGTGSWQSGDTVRTVEYGYYNQNGTYGSEWDIHMVTIRDGSGAVLDKMYYRYYTEDTFDAQQNQIGYQHGLKFVFSSASYDRLVAAKGPDIDLLLDAEVAPYADNYFEYDAEHRAVREIAQAAGASASGGQGEYLYSYDPSNNTDGFNSWKTKFVETLPDGNENIVFSNYLGLVMLKVFHDTDVDGAGPDEELGKWATYNRYDNQGHVILTAGPSAVSGYNEAYPALLDADEESTDYEFLNDDEGLVTVSRYYSEDTDTEFPGQPHDYLEGTVIREGELGDDVPQSHTEYISHSDANGHEAFFVSESVAYVNDNGTGALTTEFDYTFFTGTVQIESQKTTDPAGGETLTFNDAYGRPIWTKDAGGFISYTAYDADTGAVSKTITDVNTSLTSTFSNKPLPWSTPSGGGSHLTTSYEVDSLGRTTQMTTLNLPYDQVTYTFYDDVNHEVRVYPGWNATTGTTIGPTIITREDRDHGDGYTEVLTTSAAPTTSGTSPNLAPTGNQAIASSNLQSLSRTYSNAAGQSIYSRDYFSFSGMTYSDAADLGTLNSGTSTSGNYYQSDVSYDMRGRIHRTKRGDGMISRTVYDTLGRVKSEWIGTSDTVSGFWSETNFGQMVRTQEYKYDQNGTITETDDIGDSRLTSTIETVTWSPLVTRTTTMEYDFRGRVESNTLPDPGPAAHELSPVYRYEYDNLGRVIKETDGTGLVTTLGHYMTYDYDDENRITTITGPDADGSSGTTTDVPVTVSEADSRGLLINQTDAMGRITTYEYDGAGRQTKVTQPDPDSSDSNPAPFTEYEYDGAGNLRFATDPLGHVTENQYDRANRPIVVVQPDPDDSGPLDPPTTTYSYSAAGYRQTLSDPLNNTTTWYYDALGRVTGEVNPLNVSRNYQYDAASRLQEKIDRLSRVTRYEYNWFDQVTAEKWYESDGTTPVGTISYSYDDAGQLTGVSDPAANYGYTLDALGRTTTENQDIAGLEIGNGTTTHDVKYVNQFDVNSFRTELTASLGSTADFKNSYTPDNLQRLKSLVQQGNGGNTLAGKRMDFGFDIGGQFTSISRYAGTTTSELAINSFYKYDEAARLKQLTHTMATTAPNIGSWGTGVKSGYQFTYDDASRIDSVFSYLDGGAYYTYDNGSQLTYVVNDYQNNESYFYDANGNRSPYSTIGLNNRLEADGNGLYRYDDEGNRITHDDGYGNVTLYRYDHRNRLIAVEELAAAEPIEDDNSGWGWGVSSGGGGPADPGPSWGVRSDSGSYFDSGLGATRSFTAILTSAVEGGGLFLSLQVSSGSVGDVEISLEEHSESHTATSSVDYGSFVTTYSSGTFLSGYVTSIEDSADEGLETFELHLKFTGQPSSEVVLEGDIIDDDGSNPANYQWTASFANSSAVTEGETLYLDLGSNHPMMLEIYVEDVSANHDIDFGGPLGDAGHWIPLATGQAVYFPTFQDAELEIRESFKIHVRRAGAPSTAVEIEADILDSNLVPASRVEYAYDVFNQLIRRSVDDDADGPNDPTDTFYAFEAGQVVLQFDGDTASDLSHRYVWNPAAIDQLLADEQVTSLSSAGSVLWPLADHLGTIRDLATHNSTNHTTTIQNHRKYDSFGNVIEESNSAIDEVFGYTGRLFDDATGLQNNLNRWYDAKAGRWMSEDPIAFRAGDENLNRYVGNSPTNRIDPSGTIGVRTLTPTGQQARDWGGFLVNFLFKLDSPAPEAGYIIQKITVLRDIVPDDGSPRRRVYWEAWRVEARQVTQLWEPNYTDEAMEPSHRNTCGTVKQLGEIKFFLAKTTGYLGDPGKGIPPDPNTGFRTNNPDTDAGDLPSTTREPIWWKEPSANGEPTAYRSVTSQWDGRPTTVYVNPEYGLR